MSHIKHFIPLCVPRWQEREAIDAGAQHSDDAGFYASDPEWLEPFWQWLPLMYRTPTGRPVLLPEMLPVTTWQQNVRTLFGTEVWDRMRKHAYQAAGLRCEVCGARGKLEAHEAWALYNETGVQKLSRLLALCPYCHKSKHLGIARRLGMLPDVKRHMLKVNNWSPLQLELAIAEAYEIWEQRCDWPWTVDLSWLQENGYFYV